MASESSATDQSIDELAEEKKVGDASKCVDGEEIFFQSKEAAGRDEADNSKEESLAGLASMASISEEKLEAGDISVANVTKKEEQHEKVGEAQDSLWEPEVSNSSEPAVETNKVHLHNQADDDELLSQVQENSSDFVETFASQEPVISDSLEDFKDIEIKPTSEHERQQDEAPLVSNGVNISDNENIEAETLEAANTVSSKEKANIELIKSEDSKDEIEVLVPAKITTVAVPDTSETPEKNDIELIKSEDSKDEIQLLVPAEITALAVPDSSEVQEEIDIDSGKPASIVLPIKDLELESGSPEEQKSKENTETKEPSSNVSTIDTGVEAVGSFSNDVKPSEVAVVVEKKDDGLEAEAILTSVKIQEDLKAKPILTEAESDENASQGFGVKKDDEITEGGIETSTVPADASPLAKVSFEEENASKPGIVVEEEEETSLESDNIDTVHKVAEVSWESRNVLERDQLVDKEKVVNAEAVEGDFVDTITDTTEADVSSDQVKAPITTEIVNESLDITSKELNIAPEASEVFSKVDKISAGDENSESLKDEATTVVEAPNDITTEEEPPDQVIEEKKSESSVTETQAPAEDKLVDKEEVLNREAKEMNLQSKADGVHKTPAVVQSDFAEKSASQESEFPDSKTEDLKYNEIKPTSENENKTEEAPLVSAGVSVSECGNVEVEKQEAPNSEYLKDKVDIKLMNSEDSKDEIQVFVPAKITTVSIPDASEVLEKNVIDDSNNLTSTEVPVEDLEVVESRSSEGKNSNECLEAKELSSNVSAIDAISEFVGSSSYEAEPSEVSEVIEDKNDGLEVESVPSLVKVHEDLKAKPELGQTQSDETVSEGVEVNKDDEIVEGGIQISTVPDDIPPLAEVSYEEEEASEPGVVIEEEETSLENDSIDTAPNVAEISLEGGNVLEGNKLVDKGEVLNAEALERDLFKKITDHAEAEVSSDQAEAPTTTEIVNGALKVTSKELNIALELSEVPSEGDKIYLDNHKRECVKGKVETSVEAPKDITTTEESRDQVIEETKSESSESETQAPSEDKFVDKEKDVNQETKEINLQSQADDADETPGVVQSGFAVTSSSHEPVILESRNEDLNDTEIKPTSENQRKLVEVPLVFTAADVSKGGNVEVETQEATNQESSKDKIDIESINSEDSKDEIQVLVPVEIPAVVVSDASETPEKNDVGSRYLSLEVPVNNLVVESGSPEEQKSKACTETKEPSSIVSAIKAGGEVVGSFYEEKPSGNAEVVENKDDGLEVETLQSSVEILKDLKDKPELAQTQFDENVSEGVEVKKDDEIVDGGIEPFTVPEDVHSLAKVSFEEEKASEPGAVEDGTSWEGDIIDTVTEVSLEGGNVLEGNKLVDKEKVVKSEAVERDLVDTFTNPTDAEVSTDQIKAPVTTEIVKECDKEALERTSKELNYAPEARKVSSEVDTFSAGDEEKIESLVAGDATSVEEPKDIIAVKELLDQLVEENKSESSVSEMETPIENKLVDKEKNLNAKVEERELHKTSTDATAAEVSSEQVKPNELEVNKQALEEISKELNIAPSSEVPSEDGKLSAGNEKSESLKGEAATSADAPKDVITVEESLDPVIKEKIESSTSERENPADDELVSNDKNVNEEAEERVLVDTSSDPTATEITSDLVKASETAEIVKEDINNQKLEVTSKEQNISSEASEVPSEGDEVSAGDEEKKESLKSEEATSEEAHEDITFAVESPDQVMKLKESNGSKNEIQAPAEDKLVDKEKDVNAEAEKTDLVDTFTGPSAAEVVSALLKISETPEIVNESGKEPLELTSKELNIVPEASVVHFEGDKVSTSEEEKGESLKDKVATSLVTSEDFTAAKKSIDRLFEEKKSESSRNETEASVETTRDFDTSNLFPKAVKDITASETVQEKQDESSSDLSVEEKQATIFEDKEELNVEGALQDATDIPEQAVLGDEKEENDKLKEQDPIFSSDTGDAKLTREVSKRESSIFSKVKRSLVKAKKAILRKSPGPKTRPSEAKDVNT